MTDVVIVLANNMDIDGTLQEESAARAAKAVEVFRKTGANAVVTCGWNYRPDSPVLIAEAFQKHLIQKHGLDPKQIIIEINSRDTVGDAYFTKVNVVVPRGWKYIKVVTSDYHVERTREIFEFIFGDGFAVEIIGAPSAVSADRSKSENASLAAFKKTMAGVQKGDSQGILAALRTRHPFYSGEVYPLI